MTGFLPLFFLLQLMHWVGFALDELLFSDYREVPVTAPVFIVGVPRSGTTFLYHLMAQDTDQFTCQKLWELILAPSISERRLWLALGRLDRALGAPVCGRLPAIDRLLFAGLQDIHPMSLESPEEDYFLLLPILACFLLIVPFPFAEEFGDLAYFDTRISERRQQRILAFYKACVQRHLYVRGRDKCYLSKNPSFSSLVQSLGRAFPDCRVVCCLRSPLKAIPSQLSSVIAGAEAFASETGGTGLRDQFLDILQHYYRHLTVSLSGWPGGRRIFVTLEQMKTGGAQTVRGIYRRFGIPLGPSVDAALTAAFREARTYKSRHHYTLEQFGLQSETVYRQYADLFDRFGFAPPTPSDGGSATPTARAASHPGHHDTAAAH